MAGNSRHDVMGATDERHQAACRAYLDNACMGRPDSKVLHEVGSLLAKLSRATQSPTDLTVDLYRYYARARKAVAGLVGANEDDIALVESTSHGLGLMAAALPLHPGDNVLVCDLEFLPTVLCWQARTLNVDFEVRCVPTQGGQVRPEDFAALSAANFLPADRTQNFFTPTLVNTGAELVLFDTGLAAEGTLAALTAAGITSDQIDTVVLTHMHGDHIGGLMGADGTTPNSCAARAKLPLARIACRARMWRREMFMNFETIFIRY